MLVPCGPPDSEKRHRWGKCRGVQKTACPHPDMKLPLRVRCRIVKEIEDKNRTNGNDHEQTGAVYDETEHCGEQRCQLGHPQKTRPQSRGTPIAAGVAATDCSMP